MTQQEVIKAFMSSLKSTDKSGRAAMDEAISANSKFGSYQELLKSLKKDFKSSSNWYQFLEKYCGIIIDNEDTGAITGEDAGGTLKTVDNFFDTSADPKYPSGSSFTVKGLTLYGIPDKEDLTEKQQLIVRGLYSWWLEGALTLIEDTYGLSFEDDDVSTKMIKLEFVDKPDESYDAYVSPILDSGNKNAESLSLCVNMAKYDDLDEDYRDGELSGDSLTMVLSHELTHAIMEASLNYMDDLPLGIIEGGTAELINGIDHERRNGIMLGMMDFDSLIKSLEFGSTDKNSVYISGYILMRYFCKQASTTTLDIDKYKSTINGEGFLTNYFNRVTMTGSSSIDTITNAGNYVSIAAGSGDDTLENFANYVTVEGGSGKDFILNEGRRSKILGGKGKDFIINSSNCAEPNSLYVITSLLLPIRLIETVSENLDELFDGGKTSINSGEADDTIMSEKNKVYVNGDDGADLVINNSDYVTIYGGSGNDIVSNRPKFINFLDTSYETVSNTVVGSSNVKIDLGDGNDVVRNYGFKTKIYGGEGKDTINNYNANVTIDSGAGNDYILNQSDTINYSLDSNLTTTVATYAIDNSISAGAGNDTIANYESDVTINAGTGNDSIINENSNVKIVGGSGKDTIKNYSFYVTINSGDDNDYIFNNAVNADEDENVNISIVSGTGNDTIKNHSENTFINSGDGKDKVYNYFINASINSGADNDYIENWGSRSSITGGSGNDSIKNYAEVATINGGLGNDTIIGNQSTLGSEIFNYDSSSGDDVIFNYDSKVDKIKLWSNISSNSVSGDDVILKIGSGSLTLKDCAGEQITFMTQSGSEYKRTYK